MVDVHRSSVGAEQELVVGCSESGEKDSVSREGAHKLALLVEDEYSTAFTQDQEEVGQLRYFKRYDILFDVDPLLEVGVPLRILPHLKTLFLSRQEWQPAVQEYLGRVARLGGASLGKENVALAARQESEVEARILKFQVHRADHFDNLLLVEAPKSDSVASSDFERTRLQDHEHGAGFFETDLDVASALLIGGAASETRVEL